MVTTVDLGTITSDRLLNDGVLQNTISKMVFDKGMEYSRLNVPAIVQTVDMQNDLEIVLPGINSVEIHENVAEGQKIGITNAKMFSRELKLVKSSGIISVSDEAKIRSGANGLSLIDLQMNRLSNGLATVADKQILAELNRTPQAGTSFSIDNNGIYTAYADAEAKIDKAITAVVMSPEAAVKVYQKTNKDFGGANPASPYNGANIPGLGTPIVTTPLLRGVHDMYFVSAELEAVLFGSRAPQTYAWRNNEAGVDNLRVDTFTGAIGNFWQTDNDQAQGVVKTPWT